VGAITAVYLEIQSIIQPKDKQLETYNSTKPVSFVKSEGTLPDKFLLDNELPNQVHRSYFNHMNARFSSYIVRDLTWINEGMDLKMHKIKS
jgi:hypothetical protein